MRTVLEVAAVKDVAPLFGMSDRTLQNKILPGLAADRVAFGPTTGDGSKWVISAEWLHAQADVFARRGHDVASIPTELLMVDLPDGPTGSSADVAGTQSVPRDIEGTRRVPVDTNAVQVENANLRLELAERALTDAERQTLEQQLLAKDGEIAARDAEIARLQAMVTALTDVVRHAAAPAPASQPSETQQRR